MVNKDIINSLKVFVDLGIITKIVFHLKFEGKKEMRQNYYLFLYILFEFTKTFIKLALYPMFVLLCSTEKVNHIFKKTKNLTKIFGAIMNWGQYFQKKTNCCMRRKFKKMSLALHTAKTRVGWRIKVVSEITKTTKTLKDKHFFPIKKTVNPA